MDYFPPMELEEQNYFNLPVQSYKIESPLHVREPSESVSSVVVIKRVSFSENNLKKDLLNSYLPTLLYLSMLYNEFFFQ